MVRALQWLQRRMLWLLLATYFLGALCPRLGVAMRSVSAGTVRFPGGDHADASLPALMLGFLLVVAGVGTSMGELRRTTDRVGLLAFGLAANIGYPIVLASVVGAALFAFRGDVEVESTLMGFAMVGAMPIAGASTAWSQNANGNLALSLGLVLASTFLSPLVTPLELRAAASLTTGEHADDLRRLAEVGSRGFLILAVVLPVLAGIAIRIVLGASAARRVLPALKVASLVDLLLLNYSNAAVALPQILRGPSWPLLALTIGVTVLGCSGAFWFGWWIARVLRADRAAQTSLMYGLGMSNNGSGVVLASSALPEHPLALLPIIFYNLVQQVAAAIVDRLRRAGADAAARERPSSPAAARPLAGTVVEARGPARPSSGSLRMVARAREEEHGCKPRR